MEDKWSQECFGYIIKCLYPIDNYKQYTIVIIYYLLVVIPILVGDGSSKVYSSTWGYTTDGLVIILFVI